MSRFAQRSNAPEKMDDLNCSGEEVYRTLRELDRINRWLGGNRVTLHALKKILPAGNTTVTLADLGCGSGEMLQLIARKFPKNHLLLTGIDANPHIIRYAQQHNNSPYIGFESVNVLHPSFPVRTFDIVLATLFFHHFTTPDLIALLQQLKKQTRIAIIINDLHRHPLAYFGIRLLTFLFSGSGMVKYDAPLSVLRGFTRKEWQYIMEAAGIKHFSIRWRWAFRWQVVAFTE